MSGIGGIGAGGLGHIGGGGIVRPALSILGGGPGLYSIGEPLISSSVLTFARAACDTTYQTDAVTLAHAGENVPRYEDRGDGLGPMLLLEGARKNWVPYSQALTSWSGGTATGNTDTAPDGTASADTLWCTGPNWYDGRIRIHSLPAGTAMVASAWCKRGTQGTVAAITCDWNLADTDVNPVPVAWSRVHDKRTTGGDPSMGLYATLGSGTSGVLNDNVVWWGMQAEAAPFPSSYIPTADPAVTRPEDSATLAHAHPIIRAGHWTWEVSPVFGSADLVSGDIYYLVSFGASTDCLRVRHDGTGVLIEAVVGNAVKAASPYVTFARNHAVSSHGPQLTINAIAATIGVANATTGSGTGATGAAWAWPDATCRVGGIAGGLGTGFVRIKWPRKAN